MTVETPIAETVFRQQLEALTLSQIHEHVTLLRGLIEFVIDEHGVLEPEERESHLSDALDHAVYLETLLERMEAPL